MSRAHESVATDARPTTRVLFTSSVPSSDTWEEDQRDHQPPLGVELTGYHLTNIIVILGSGIWKLVSSYPALPVTLSRVELGLATLLAVVLYHVKAIHDKHPELCPRFFKVDLAPPILKFVRRSEFHLFLLSLLPLWPAVALLQSAQNVRRAAKLGDQVYGSSITVGNALAVAIVGLILGIAVTLQQFTQLLSPPLHSEHSICRVVPTAMG
ncbi:hypothetical protein BJV74DRAFT_496167 [Russula compacta]|nr:hypothetical protein BJV74DRAFT_496167 [Russula compacta]